MSKTMQPKISGEQPKAKQIPYDELRRQIEEAKQLLRETTKENRDITHFFIIIVGLTVLAIVVAVANMYIDSHRQMMSAYRDKEKAILDVQRYYEQYNYKDLKEMIGLLRSRNPYLK